MSCSPSSSLSFLIKGPIILAFLFLINLMTPGPWWVQWAALGIGIAWVFTLLRAVKLLFVVGGLAGLAALLARRRM
jgi:hypothetical protein